MKRLGTLGLLMMALLALAGCGASPASQLAEGNEAYTAGDYDTAVQNYRAAQAIDPDAPEPIFNIANALYRQGLPSEAQKLLELAQDVLPEEAQALAQNIWFNLGNARYEAGQATAAVEAYKQALRLDPTDQDAKYNLELALLQENQQEQEQEQQEQDDSSGEQEQEQEQQESGSEQSDQNEGDPSDQTGENGEQNEQNEQNEENGQSEDQPSEPEDGQGEAGEPQEPESDGEQAAQPNAGQGEPTDETGQSYTIPEQLEGLTPEQAEQLLGAVGENTQTLQERLQQIFVVPGGPGDKDW